MQYEWLHVMMLVWLCSPVISIVTALRLNAMSVLSRNTCPPMTKYTKNSCIIRTTGPHSRQFEDSNRQFWDSQKRDSLEAMQSMCLYRSWLLTTDRYEGMSASEVTTLRRYTNLFIIIIIIIMTSVVVHREIVNSVHRHMSFNKVEFELSVVINLSSSVCTHRHWSVPIAVHHNSWCPDSSMI